MRVPSWMLVFLPMTTSWTSPRMTALYQMEDPAPIFTRPTTMAPGQSSTSCSISGEKPS